MAAIRTENLTKRYGSGDDAVLALDGLDLTVEEGEVFGFLGPNGAGKSTTINVLLSFAEPTAGSATVLGHDVTAEPRAIRERTGVLPEGFGVFERLTAREHLAWVVETNDADDDPAELLAQVGIADAADRRAGQFSKGMRQRLALGMALVGDPDLLVLDEPSTGLDPAGMQEIRDLIHRKADSGTTVFFSSHVLEQVEKTCDRVGMLRGGELVALDTIENLRDRSGGPAGIEVEVGAVPDGDLRAVDGVRSVRTDGDAVTAICEDASVKVDVVRWLDDRTAVTDIVSEDASLEELFNRFAGDGGGDDSVERRSGGEREEEAD